MKMKKIFLLGLSVFFTGNFLVAFAHTNFSRPYDINFRMAQWKGKDFRLGVNAEYGTTSSGRDWDENKVGTLRIYNDSESALTMLMGAQRGSDIYNLANALLPAFAPATDDGVRGHFKLDGKYEELALTVHGKYNLPIEAIPGNFDISFYIPFRSMDVKNVKWNDQTKSVLNADLNVHRLLTDDIDTVVKDLGDLDLKSWSKTGLSDLAFMLGWYMDFKQMKEHLKNVRVNVRLGLTVPSGEKKKEDKVLSMPLGNDGAWGIPVSLGLDLDFVSNIKAGLDLELLFLGDQTRTRRLKTDENQTDFLLLNKGKATKSFGVTYKFNLFFQVQRFFKGLSGMVAYQFLKHDDDKLTSQSNDFSYHVINSAQSLKEWGTQNFVFQFNYDFFNECKDFLLKPQLSVFYKLPVAGKRVLNSYTFGGQVAFNF